MKIIPKPQKPTTISDQNGQGLMEYVIISSLIGLFCLVAIQQFGKIVETRIRHMKSRIVETIKVN